MLFALHRPFVSLSPSSRSKACYFATQILDFQARLFDRTEPPQHKCFNLVLATFDATVPIATMHIRFPNEFSDQAPTAKRNLEWDLDKLELLQPTNDLASSTFSVIQKLYRQTLAIVSPSQCLPSSRQGAGCGIFAESDLDMFLSNWDVILQPVEDTIPGHTFNDAICDSAFEIPSRD